MLLQKQGRIYRPPDFVLEVVELKCFAVTAKTRVDVR